MSRVLFLCLLVTVAFIPAGDTRAQNTGPAPTSTLDADRAKSNALTPEQRDQAQNLFKNAFDLFQANNLDAARLGFERGLVIDPANANAIFYLAEILLRKGDKSQARVLYGKVIALDPNAAVALQAEIVLKNLAESDPKVLTAEKERALKAKDTFKECEQCPEMVVVPAGSFMMGSPANEEGRRDNEGPQHRVTFVRPFAVGKFAVTFDEWDACVAGGGCNGYKPHDRGWGLGRQPVINVSWNDAKAYVAWLSRKTSKPYRLLSESEREYVTRAGTTTPFWWGSQISPDLANYNGTISYRNGPKGEYRERTLPVESFSPNLWGLYQVHGNVYDWTEDCWNQGYHGAPIDGAARISRDCSHRVCRGGSWSNFPELVRSDSRYGFSADDRLHILGFRVGRTLSP